AAGSLFFTPGILPSAPSGPPSAFAPLLRRSASPKKSNQKKSDPDEAPSLREGSRRASGGFRRHNHCAGGKLARIVRATLRAWSPARRRFIRDPRSRQSRRKRVVVGWADKPGASCAKGSVVVVGVTYLRTITCIASVRTGRTQRGFAQLAESSTAPGT